MDKYAAPIVPLRVYKNGPLLLPSFGPLTTRSTDWFAGLPKCIGTMTSRAKAAVAAGEPLKYPDIREYVLDISEKKVLVYLQRFGFVISCPKNGAPMGIDPNSPPGAVILDVGRTKVPPLPDCWTAGLMRQRLSEWNGKASRWDAYPTRTTLWPSAFSAVNVALGDYMRQWSRRRIGRRDAPNVG